MKALIIEDDSFIAMYVAGQLEEIGFKSTIVGRYDLATPLLKDYFHVIICDHNFYENNESTDTMALGNSIYFELRNVLKKRTPFYHFSGFPCPEEYIGKNPDPNFFFFGKDDSNRMVEHIATITGRSEQCQK